MILLKEKRFFEHPFLFLLPLNIFSFLEQSRSLYERQRVSGRAVAEVEHVKQGGPGQAEGDERYRATVLVHVAFALFNN